MEKKRIEVTVSWADKNYCCGWEDGQGGVVLVTGKTLEELKDNFREALEFHIEGLAKAGDEVPVYLSGGNYEIEFNLDAAALLRDAETYTTISAISRASGINMKLLSHYANGLKHPRPLQLERIKAGLNLIGSHLLALS